MSTLYSVTPISMIDQQAGTSRREVSHVKLDCNAISDLMATSSTRLCLQLLNLSVSECQGFRTSLDRQLGRRQSPDEAGSTHLNSA